MTEHADLLPRYKHLRQAGLELNNRLVETLSKNILDEGGKRLGILKKGVLVLDTEDMLAVLMDYCIYDVRRGGANAVERYLAESPPAPDSDEMVLLQAMRQARYSLFAVESAERGVGVHVRDLLRDEPLFIVDVGFSRTASAGMVLAARVMAPEGIHMTTGAALPVAEVPPAERARFLDSMVRDLRGADYADMSPEEASDLATMVIRTCLGRGAAERIRYAEPRARTWREAAPPAPPAARRVGRNDPCPCGSGKKVKHCCGRR
jgi:hypothetical protein